MKKILPIITALLLIYSSALTYKILDRSIAQPQIDTITIPGDQIFTEITIMKPVPYKVTVTDTIVEYIPVDSATCIQDYKDLYKALAASKAYSDTLKNDSSATVVINTTISYNNIDSISMSFKNNRNVQVIQPITNTINNKLMIGMYMGNNIIAPTVIYNTPRKIGVGVGYNLLTNSPTVMLTYNIK